MSAAPDQPRTVSLVEAAAALGVHYMTAYRYVRTGRLAADLDGHEWRVRLADLEAFRAPRPAPDGTGPRVRAPRLVDRLIAGDETGAWRIIEDALAAGSSPTDIHLDLLVPALRRVGEGWRAGRVSVADEHRASATARRLIARLGPQFARPGRKRGTVVVGAVAGEWHDIPAALVADQLRGAGYAVVELGANTPGPSFAETARRESALAVLISVTTPGLDDAVRAATDAVRATGTPVVVGGAAVSSARVAASLGSDAWAGRDARDVVTLVERLRDERASRRRRV